LAQRAIVACFTDVAFMGGGATQARFIAKKLKERGYEVIVLSKVSSDKKLGYKEIEGITVFYHRVNPGICWRTPLLVLESKIKEVLRSNFSKPDVFIAISPYYVNAAKAIWPNVNIIFIFPCLLTECFKFIPEYWGKSFLCSWFNKKLMARCERKALMTSHTVVIQNGIILNQVERFLGGKKMSYSIVSPGVTDIKKNITLSRTEVRKSFGTPQDSCVFMCAGNIDANKNFSAVIEAFRRCSFTNSYLWIVGDGPLLANMQHLVNNYCLSDRILLLGYRKNMPDIYNAADVFVHSAHYDAAPNVYLEAMVSGLPVVGPRNGFAEVTNPLCEMIEEGVEGYLYRLDRLNELSSIMEFLAADSCMRKKVGAAARHKALSFFNWDQWVNAIENLFLKAKG